MIVQFFIERFLPGHTKPIRKLDKIAKIYLKGDFTLDVIRDSKRIGGTGGSHDVKLKIDERYLRYSQKKELLLVEDDCRWR